MDKLRIGIIGIGNMGWAHAKCIANHEVEHLELTCLCDINPKQLDMAKSEYPNIPCFSNYFKLLVSGLADCVLIATPHILHPEIAINAFKYGLHVLSEKPAGVSISQVRAMNNAAVKSQLTFGIMFNQRTNPLYRKAREIVQSGKLGQLKRFVWIITNWYRTQAYYDSSSWRATWQEDGGGVLLNQAPHNLDMWQWIIGMPTRIRAFCCSGKYHYIEVEDDATIYAEYANGATATFITSTGEYPGTNRLEISGDLGKLVLEDGRLKWWKTSQSEREICFSSIEGFHEQQLQYEEILLNEVETGHKGILQNFTNAILFGEELLSPGFDGIQELSISNAAYLSSWMDDWVAFPFNEAEFDEKLHALAKKSVLKTLSKKEQLGEKYNQRWQVRW